MFLLQVRSLYVYKYVLLKDISLEIDNFIILNHFDFYHLILFFIIFVEEMIGKRVYKDT